MTMDFEEFKRRSELITHSEEGELENMFDQVNEEEEQQQQEIIKPKYDGKTFPEKEVDHIKMRALWEYLGYLEISLKCFNIALKYINSDFFMIKAQIANYGKFNIDDFIYGNDYARRHNSPMFSFKIFNGYIRDNADIRYKMQFHEEHFAHLKNEIEKNPEYQKGLVEEKNEILDRVFMLDDWAYIEPMNDRHKEDFLDFFTDEKVFEELYGLAEKEIKKNDKKANNRLRLMLKDKFDIFQDVQNSFSGKLMPRLTNQYLINWLILLQEYIEKTILLLSESSKTDVDTKLLAYIFKTLCNYGMNISVKDDVFVNFMKELLGTSLSTTSKYLRSSDMGYKESVLDTWIKGLELLETLDKENPLVRKCIRKSLIKDDPSTKDIKMTKDQLAYIEKLKKDYPAPDSKN